MLPAKNRGKFEKEEDLISCLKKREALLKQANLVTKWIFQKGISKSPIHKSIETEDTLN